MWMILVHDECKDNIRICLRCSSTTGVDEEGEPGVGAVVRHNIISINLSNIRRGDTGYNSPPFSPFANTLEILFAACAEWQETMAWNFIKWVVNSCGQLGRGSIAAPLFPHWPWVDTAAAIPRVASPVQLVMKFFSWILFATFQQCSLNNLHSESSNERAGKRQSEQERDRANAREGAWKNQTENECGFCSAGIRCST